MSPSLDQPRHPSQPDFSRQFCATLPAPSSWRGAPELPMTLFKENTFENRTQMLLTMLLTVCSQVSPQTVPTTLTPILINPFRIGTVNT